MLEAITPEQLKMALLVLLSGLGTVLTILGIQFAQKRLLPFLKTFISPSMQELYRRVIQPYQLGLGILVGLSIVDLIFITVPLPNWVDVPELLLSLSAVVLLIWVGSRLVKQTFDVYLLDVTLRSGRKVNSELLIVGKVLVNLAIVLVALVTFAQTHQVNIIGLFASLGIGGLAVAFSAQKTLEQLLGGVVIYVDRPFVVDDYIGLPDGTFGRVESIGLRSTKIRTSGKGTLKVIPNNSLTQLHIENFSGGKKVMSLFYLVFERAVTLEEQALIRQVILESTEDIIGIDNRSTDIVFRDTAHPEDPRSRKTEAQITLFILGTGEVSLELRRQLLDLANQNMTRQLKKFDIDFKSEQPTIYVDAPITI